MLICIADVIDDNAVAAIRKDLAGATWIDGNETAGHAARLVKSNEQVSAKDAVGKAVKDRISAALLGNELFRLAAQPRALGPIIISRYKPGMAYGSHVDNAMMGEQRSDVSYTLFLSEPDSYDGGSLVIESAAGEQDYKLAAGSLVVYPATSLHRVESVTRGERLAAVGWVRSLIRSTEQRELLFDLETARRSLFAAHGKTRDYDLISKCASNLLRLWAED